MQEENSTPIDVTDDLDAFSNDLFGVTPKEEKVETPSDDAEDTSSDDDTVATNDEDATDAEGDDNDPEEDIVPEKPKKQTAQERISELTKARREAERQRDELEARLKALETPKAEVKTEAPIVVGAPTPDDKNEDGSDKYPLGEYDPKFNADLTKYNTRMAWEEIQQAEAEKATQTEQQKAIKQTATEWEAKLQQAEETIGDVRESAGVLMNELSRLPEEYGEYLAMTLMSLDKGPEVVAYLAANMDETRKLVASGATKATIALGRIEARFIAEDGKVKPKVTNTPEPPKNLNRGSNGKFAVSPDTDDLDAFSDLYYSKRR